MKNSLFFNNRNLFLILSIVLIFVSACKKDDDDDKDPDGPITDETIELTCQDFESDIKLKNSDAAVDYLIDCSVYVTNDIEVEPGTVIAFTSGSFLYVQSGSLNAVGTEDDPIVFRGEEQETGEWSGINISSNSSKNQLKHVEINHTGNDAITGTNSAYAIVLYDGKISLEDVKIKDCDGYGIYIFEEVNVADFENITITDVEYSPIVINLNQLELLDTDEVKFEDNGNNYIYLVGSNVDKNTTIYSSEIPYFASSGFDITADLKIEGDVEILMNPGTYIYVKPTGSLNMVGESGDITIRGLEEEKGYWNGIYVESTSSKNVFENVNISDAGKDWVRCCNVASLYIAGSISLNDVRVSNGEDRGIVILNDASIKEFKDVTVTTHDLAPIVVSLNNLRDMDIPSCSFDGNEIDRIYVYNEVLDKDVKLDKGDEPYFFYESEAYSIEANIEIEEGTTVMFSASSGMYIKNTGSLTAEGTDSDKISFIGIDDSKGYWNGIYIESTNSKNSLENILLKNAGGDWVRCCAIAALTVNGSLKIKDSEFSTIKNCAFRYDDNDSNIEIDNLTFTDVETETCDL